jgi:hypothetical protein
MFLENPQAIQATQAIQAVFLASSRLFSFKPSL